MKYISIVLYSSYDTRYNCLDCELHSVEVFSFPVSDNELRAPYHAARCSYLRMRSCPLPGHLRSPFLPQAFIRKVFASHNLTNRSNEVRAWFVCPVVTHYNISSHRRSESRGVVHTSRLFSPEEQVIPLLHSWPIIQFTGIARCFLVTVIIRIGFKVSGLEGIYPSLSPCVIRDRSSKMLTLSRFSAYIVVKTLSASMRIW